MKVIPINQAERLFFKLRWIAAASALAGMGALVFHVFRLLPMPYFIVFMGTPSLILLFTAAALARKLNATVFYRNLVTGLYGGLVATIVYDLVRYALRSIGLFNYNGFRAIYIFGGWITNTNPESMTAAYAGWMYHFWNGISFGIFFALTFPARHWIYGVVYGIMMEVMMLGLFPFFLHVTDKVDFIALSLIGHVFYGFILGWICRRYTLSWKI